MDASELRFRQIVDSIPGLVHTMTAAGEVEFVNQQVLDFTGATLEELKKDWAPLIHPDDRARVLALWNRSVETGQPFEAEHRARRVDGGYRWLHSRGLAMRDSEGRIVRWYNLEIDIDERKQADARLAEAFNEIRELKDRLQRENIALREEVDQTSMFEEIVGTSPALRSVLSQISKVAATDSTVLISGETGTGKELVARAIHKRSSRTARPFVSVNCAAIPSTLVASELFGHEKGAFTGAIQRRLGRFELAEGGTLFLDEVGDLPAETQVALLRVLQEREFERVGSSRAIRADVRVIAATNRELQGAIADKSFRADLFYRLNVFPIEVPALRDRREDIPILVEYFTHRYAKRMGKRIREVGNKNLDLLQSYRWPGNIRELQNLIERAVIVADGETLSIDERWLSADAATSPAPPGLAATSKTLADQERDAIEAALTEAHGRVAGPLGAAAKLGLPSSTLETKIKALHIDKRRFKPIGRAT